MKHGGDKVRRGGGITKISGDSQAILYGINPIIEALSAGAAVECIHMASNMRHHLRQALEDAASERGVQILGADKKSLDRMAQGGVHQGVVAVWGLPKPVPLEVLAEDLPVKGRRLLLCLDEVQDPRNVGALARSALAFGATGIVIPHHRSAGLTPAAIKASAGALCWLPVARETNMGQVLDRLKEMGFWISGAVMDDAQEPWAFDPGDKVALVLGAEGSGLRRSIEGKLDFRVCIPMQEKSESLNVSVAGAVLMYEWLARSGRKGT